MQVSFPIFDLLLDYILDESVWATTSVVLMTWTSVKNITMGWIPPFSRWALFHYPSLPSQHVITCEIRKKRPKRSLRNGQKPFFTYYNVTYTKNILLHQSLILFNSKKKSTTFSFYPEQNPDTPLPNTNTSALMRFAQYKSYMKLLNTNSPQIPFQGNFFNLTSPPFNFLHRTTCNKTKIINKASSII